MGNIRSIRKVMVDFDNNTSRLLWMIVNGSLMASNHSGIPIDPEYYNSIQKLKTLSNFNGAMTIELTDTITADEDYLKSNGVSKVE